MSVFQDLYDSEINFLVSCFWDGGFEVALGDELNGWKVRGMVIHFGMVEHWLAEAAIRHFPDSVFARMYRDGMSRWSAGEAMKLKATEHQNAP